MAWQEVGDKVKWKAPDGTVMTGEVTFVFMDGVLTVMPDQANSRGKSVKVRIDKNQIINAVEPVEMDGKKYRSIGPSMGNQFGRWEFDGGYGWKEVKNLEIRKKLDQKFGNSTTFANGPAPPKNTIGYDDGYDGAYNGKPDGRYASDPDYMRGWEEGKKDKASGGPRKKWSAYHNARSKTLKLVNSKMAAAGFKVGNSNGSELYRPNQVDDLKELTVEGSGIKFKAGSFKVGDIVQSRKPVAGNYMFKIKSIDEGGMAFAD